MTVRATAAQIKRWRALTTRAERVSQALFLVEGEHMASEAVRMGSAQMLLLDERKADRFGAVLAQDISCTLLTPAQFAQISQTRTPQGVAALCRIPPAPTLKDLGQRVVALNGVQDPGNVGTILRTMDAAGFTGLLTDTDTADVFSPKALSASMGSIFRVPVHVAGDLPLALDSLAGFAIIAGDLSGAPFYDRPPTGPNVCLLIGSEGSGLAQPVLEKATVRLKLPMVGGAESLNAAVAASVMMYDLLRETTRNLPLS